MRIRRRPLLDRYRIEKLIEDAYGTAAEHPFEKDPSISVFRHISNRKWFAVIMEIPKIRLGLKEEGTVAVINTKCDFILINSFLSEKGFFPAYHMNKRHWITTLLDGTVPEERILSLVDISFELTNVKRNKKQ